METNILAEHIKEWFNSRTGHKNKWNDNEVGSIIKSELIKSGNWKISYPTKRKESLLGKTPKKQEHCPSNAPKEKYFWQGKECEPLI